MGDGFTEMVWLLSWEYSPAMVRLAADFADCDGLDMTQATQGSTAGDASEVVAPRAGEPPWAGMELPHFAGPKAISGRRAETTPIEKKAH